MRWVVHALLEAEWHAISRSDAGRADMPLSWPADDTGMSLGLPPDWARRMVAQVGNYAEIYERNLGPGAQRPLPRGPNRLWREGGLMVPLLLH